MPSLSDLPGEIKRKKFTKALKRLGFEIDKTGGKGDHHKITWPKTQKSITIQSKLNKQVLYYVLKEIKEYSGIDWDEIKKYL